MRKKCTFFLCAALIISMLGCAAEVPLSPVTFYYPRLEVAYHETDPVILGESRESAGYDGDIASTLSAYLDGPQSGLLLNPFPKDTRLVSAVLEERTLSVCLTDEVAQLKGLDLNLACISLAKTAMSLCDASRVRIQAETENLDSQDFILLTADKFQLELDANFNERNGE